MSNYTILPTCLVTGLILLIFLTLPVVSSADQVEDIPDAEQQTHSANGRAISNGDGQSASTWQQLLNFIGRSDEKPARSIEQEAVTLTPDVTQPATPEPAISTVNSFAEKQAEEKGEQIQTNLEKDEQDRIAAEKTEPARPAVEKAEHLTRDTEEVGRGQMPATKTVTENQTVVNGSTTRPETSKSHSTHQREPDESQSLSIWQRLMVTVGLNDDYRQTIPPLEMKNVLNQVGQDYIIGSGDQLGISVWRDDALTKTVVVLPDGKINFPLIGEIRAGGRTVAELKQDITEKLSSYVVDADILVEVKQSNSLYIFVTGRVNSPGRHMLVADTTVLQAIAMAGGLNTFAEKDNIKLLRQEGNKTLVYSFRYSLVTSGNNLDDNRLLKRGDVIVIP